MSEYNLFNRWKVKKSVFWIIIAGVSIITIISIATFSFFRNVGRTSSSSLFAPMIASNTDGGYYPEDKAYAEEPELAPWDDDEYTVSNSASSLPTERLIIREGNIQIKVEDTRETREDIEAIVNEMKSRDAFVVSSTENSRGEDLSPNIYMVIRVPVEDFDSVMKQLAGMAVEVIYSNTWGEDVTEEAVVLSSNIDSLEAARDRLLEIMKNADTTEDLLQAEQQLTYRETEIKSLKARLEYLEESARLSRISITLEPYILNEPIDTKWNPNETFREAKVRLVESLQNFADGLIFFATNTLPWLVFYVIVFGGIGLIVLRIMNKRGKKENKGE